MTTGDHFLIADFTDSNANKKITADHFGTHLAGPGLESTATGQLELALEEPGLVTALEDTDIVVLADASDSFATKRTADRDARHPFRRRQRARNRRLSDPGCDERL